MIRKERKTEDVENTLKSREWGKENVDVVKKCRVECKIRYNLVL